MTSTTSDATAPSIPNMARRKPNREPFARASSTVGPGIAIATAATSAKAATVARLMGTRYRTLIAVARHRLSRPSRRNATARTRARPRTMTTASTTPSRGSPTVVDPIVKAGRVGC